MSHRVMVIFHSHQLLLWSLPVDADYKKVYPNASELCSLGQAKKKKKKSLLQNFFLNNVVNTGFCTSIYSCLIDTD